MIAASFFDALTHVGVVQKYPDVRVFTEVKVPKRERPPPVPAVGNHRKQEFYLQATVLLYSYQILTGYIVFAEQ